MSQQIFKQNKSTNLEKNSKLNKKYLNLNPKCEPHLSKRGLYRTVGPINPNNKNENIFDQFALLWVLSFSDGKNSLYDIVQRSGYDFEIIKNAVDILCKAKLLEEISK